MMGISQYPTPEQEIKLPNLIESVNRVVVVTGAGFSAPSGLPVYRNGGANWLDAEGEAMSHAARYANHLPELWERWHRLAHQSKNAEPNTAHFALARWERMLRARIAADGAPGWLKIVTQNVDGLHARAGSQDVLEVHGSILRAKRLNRTETFEYEPTPKDPRPPEAPNGSRRTRPDIVLFGERPRRMPEAARAAAAADLVVFAGTSGRVWPVAGLLEVANEAGTPALLFNQEEWDHGEFQFTVLDDVLALDTLVPAPSTDG